MPTPFVQTLASGPVDIIGDVHGEVEALRRLLARLGCDPDRGIAQRPVVFVGDLVDRGPDSPGVVRLVMQMVRDGIAQAVLGNHEFNVLRHDEKEGNGWLLGQPHDHHPVRRADGVVKVPFASRAATPAERAEFLAFFSELPLALERPDLRVAHACWSAAALAQLPPSGDAAALSMQLQEATEQQLAVDGILEREMDELARWHQLRRVDIEPTEWLEAHAHAEQARQLGDPVRVLTSGPERRIDGPRPFFVGGKWRYVQRDDWWHRYTDEPAVVVGHYWRTRHGKRIEGKQDTWSTPRPTDWTGPRNNVFCVDFSVGRRFLERWEGRLDAFHHGLAALRWPERELVFDDGWRVEAG